MPAALAASAASPVTALPAGRRARLVHLRPVAAHLRRPGQRPAAGPHRRTQIAYGVDSRVQSLIATGGGADQLAGIVGRVVLRGQRLRASRRTTPRPASPSTASPPTAPSTTTPAPSRRSTACSTMLALDAHPAARRIAQTAHVQDAGRHHLPPGRGRHLSGGATAVTPTSTWTGESQYAGTGYAACRPAAPRPSTSGSTPTSLVIPVVDLQPGVARRHHVHARAGRSARSAPATSAPQGDSPAPGCAAAGDARRAPSRPARHADRDDDRRAPLGSTP